MKLGEWLQRARQQLEANGVEAAKLEAQLLAAHVLRVDRPYLVTHVEDEIPELPFDAVLARRLGHEPLAYILGHKEFWNRDFVVTPAVLIPRQDTEILVEASIKGLPLNSTVLDMGTGSGCIAITLKLERSDLTVLASDISSRALDIAQLNAQRLQAEIDFVKMDRLEAIRHVDAIISNPPYIDRSEPLEDQVRGFEPESALFAEENGLHFYKYLSSSARILQWLGLEIGYRQEHEVRSMFADSRLNRVESRNDLQGHTRCLIFKT